MINLKMNFALKMVPLLAFVSDAAPSIDEHRQDFATYDANKDGFIDPSEVRALYDGIKSWDLSAYFVAVDANENGLIDLDEFLAANEKHDSGDLDVKDY
jgi:Ca2+-binding EF-hand superfamily protein